MCRQVSLIRSHSISAHTSSSPLSTTILCFLLSLYSNVCQRFICPCDGSSTFGRLLCGVSCPGALKQSMERKTHRGFWLCSAGYLWRGSIHPFCALRAGSMRVGILGSEGCKRGNNPPKKHGWWTVRTASASGFQNTVLPECTRV